MCRLDGVTAIVDVLEELISYYRTVRRVHVVRITHVNHNWCSGKPLSTTTPLDLCYVQSNLTAAGRSQRIRRYVYQYMFYVWIT